MTGTQTSDIMNMSEGEQARKQISLETQALMILLTENKREKIFGNLLTNSQNYDIITTKEREGHPTNQKGFTL